MKRLKNLLTKLGPGFITGASDDDPSGIATYSQTGALFGFQQLWTALFAFPLMTAVQEMCGRIGLVTGKGLAGVIREYYPRRFLYVAVFLLFVANTINLGADLGAMAEAGALLVGLPSTVWLIGMAAASLALEVFVSYKTYASYLKYLTFALFSYVVSAFVVSVDWGHAVASTLTPYIAFKKEYLLNIVAVLGTTISPYLFFWQASEEVEEEVAHHRLRQMGAGQPKVTPRDLTRLRFDTIVGMFFSQAIMWFVITTTGATLFASGTRSIESAADAAVALRPLAGDFASLLFALGIIGTGFLAIPILAGAASYAVSEAFGWKEGLSKSPAQARGFYGVIAFATLVGMLINFLGINSITFLYYTAVINGIIAPPLLVMILSIANNRKILGERVNSVWLNVLGIVTIILMSVAALALLANVIIG